MNQNTYLSMSVENITLGEPLPVSIYVFVQGRFILFREEGSTLTPEILGRFQKKKVAFIFVREDEMKDLTQWIKETTESVNIPISQVPLFEVRKQTMQSLMEAFEVPGTLTDGKLEHFETQGKEIVKAVLQAQISRIALSDLQKYSISLLEHSLNVSFLSVYVAAQMGYDHRLTLESIALAGLLHDIGQVRIKVEEKDTDSEVEEKFRQHPNVTGEMLDEVGIQVPLEVQLMVTQHHEYHDGSGFPKGMRGSMIYDLARIVSLVNFYDQLVRGNPGPWALRQKRALNQLTEEYSHRFEPKKLEKFVRILEESLSLSPKSP
jgi:putative nucleotidyltransferase with HDIG domain